MTALAFIKKPARKKAKPRKKAAKKTRKKPARKKAKPRKKAAKKTRKKPARKKVARKKAKPRKKATKKARKKPARKKPARKKATKKARKKPARKKPARKKVKPRKKPTRKKPPKKKTKRGPTVRDWVDIIRDSLIETAFELDLGAFISNTFPLVVPNADGSVDGELRLPVASQSEARNLIRQLYRRGVVPPGVWFTVGAAYEPTARKLSELTERDRYRVYMDALDVSFSYGSLDLPPYGPRYRGLYFANALEMVDRMKEAHGLEVSEIVFRLTYNGKIEVDNRPGHMEERV